MQPRDRMPVDRYCAALPLALGDDGDYWVMLIQGRNRAVWAVPQTTVRQDVPAHITAAGEAFERAGVCGSVAEQPIGDYRFVAARGSDRTIVAEVEVFVLAVDEQLETTESHLARPVMWIPLKDAPDIVAEPGLSKLLIATEARLRHLPSLTCRGH